MREETLLALLEEITLQLRRIAYTLEKPSDDHGICKRCGFSRLETSTEKCPVCRTEV